VRLGTSVRIEIIFVLLIGIFLDRFLGGGWSGIWGVDLGVGFAFMGGAGA
jgi:hypothetical protein